jgi:uncharacterized protein (TIGR00730 family)
MSDNNQTSRTVCVYCGASPNVAQEYKDIARKTGKALAREEIRVVYGGGRSGLMGIVADAALTDGAKVIGIIPGHIDKREIRHEELSELHVVDSMHERKSMMAERTDIFVVLPGGCGTMDEFFEILTWRQIGLHDKPILILNELGYWDPLLELLSHIKTQKFMKEKDFDLFNVFTNLEDMMKYIKNVQVTNKPVHEELM